MEELSKVECRGARVVVYFEVAARRTVSWRVSRDAELRIGKASVWLTRHRDPYDYWMQPGDVLRLVRGERVWLSSDCDHAVEVSVTSYRKARERPAWTRMFARFFPRSVNAI
ncbi:DUF2917 domain-containing protein [Caballeronia sp. ATUFL_M2_KS44]|uniref:DUF2917 domain-containing protein n=1 Tax=Caballeronia sp. ATUFL_M2_KS44 TaxID=2921767 RepID=UPI002028BD8A|nr:DUF2917 domain-containing protein [Caballeronia sp. ATUFL_M2_KS44]